MAQNPLILSLIDENGTSTKSIVHIAGTDPEAALVTAYLDAVDACTTANLVGAALQVTVDYAGMATGGAYDAEDKLVMSFLDIDDQVCHVTVAAPQEACFGADGKTADPLAAIIIALVAAILDVVVTASGKTLTAWVKGWRSRRNRKKK